MIKVTTNPDKQLVEEIREKIKINKGHCCCAITFNDDNRCMCKDFRDKIEREEPGMCDCGLYVLTIQND